MKIDRPRAYRTAARQTHLCLAKSREQRSEGKHAGPHRFDQLIRGLKHLDIVCGYLVRPKLRCQNGRTKVLEQPSLRNKVLYIRDVMKRDRVTGQQRGRKTGQGRVFRPADLDLSSQRIAAAYLEFVHLLS